MAAETENNPPASETKDIKEMKDALKDESSPPDNKQDENAKAKAETKTEKKEDAEKKAPEDAAAAAAAGGDANAAGADASNATAAAAAAAPAKAPSVHKANFEKDVVYLYQFPRTPQLPSVSPYCLKVEIWLRLNAIKYEVSAPPIFIRFIV